MYLPTLKQKRTPEEILNLLKIKIGKINQRVFLGEMKSFVFLDEVFKDFRAEHIGYGHCKMKKFFKNENVLSVSPSE